MDYTKIYNNIIRYAQNRTLEGYKEIHHIVPKCMGGVDEKDNLVELTAKEHFLCHKLLCEIHPNNPKLLYALWLMAIGKKKIKGRDPYSISSRDYERVRMKVSEKRKGIPISPQQKDKIGRKNSKQVFQYDLNGNYIQSFPSAKEAERIILGKPEAHWKNLPNNIDAACRLTQKSAYGFIWKYQKEKIILEQHKGAQNKKNGNPNSRT